MVEGADLDLRKMVESLKDLKEGEFIWGACIDIGEKLHYSPEVTEELKKEMEAKKYNLMLPPTTEEGFKVLWERCDQLKEAGAAWIGFNNLPMGDYIFQLTDIIIQLHKRVNIPVMMHFTAGNCTKAQIKELLDKMKEAGIRNLFPMLGGAPPKEWTYASDIIEFIKEEYGDYWCLSGCCYPLVHRHSKNMEDEIKFTKVKVDAGCHFIVTQPIYEEDVMLKFVDLCRAADIKVPIAPGIMPSSWYPGFQIDTTTRRTRVPEDLAKLVEDKQDNAEAFEKAELGYLEKQIRNYISKGLKLIQFDDRVETATIIKLVKLLKKQK